MRWVLSFGYTRYMTKALRGINLGGWLVAERWMTPRLFDGVTSDGEIALVQELGSEEARRRLTRHRDSFITGQDFKRIADMGFDFVRLPVGYWLFETTDDFIDGEEYLGRAFTWAEHYGLGIILDFHGLQGSQNGYDHSGQVGKVRLYRRGNRGDALRTLAYMCKAYGQRPELLAIEVINEPKIRWFLWRLLRYYDRAIAIAEEFLRPGAKIIVSDAFKARRMARALSRRGYSSRVVLDIHLYQVFSKRDQSLTFEEHIEMIESEWRPLLSEVAGKVPVLVGEWSAALPAAAEGEHRNHEYFHSQQEAFDETVWAHSYWSYKAPGNGAWDYQSQTRFR